MTSTLTEVPVGTTTTTGITREEFLAENALARERLEGRLCREIGPHATLPKWMTEGAE